MKRVFNARNSLIDDADYRFYVGGEPPKLGVDSRFFFGDSAFSPFYLTLSLTVRHRLGFVNALEKVK